MSFLSRIFGRRSKPVRGKDEYRVSVTLVGGSEDGLGVTVDPTLDVIYMPKPPNYECVPRGLFSRSFAEPLEEGMSRYTKRICCDLTFYAHESLDDLEAVDRYRELVGQ